MGVDLSKESQESAPYRKDSIQYYMVQTIIDKHDYLIDDDGCMKLLDLVAIDKFRTSNRCYLISFEIC